MAAPQKQLYTQGQIYKANLQPCPLMHSTTENSSGMFLMYSPLVSHNITAALPEYRPEVQKYRRIGKEVMQKCGLIGCLCDKAREEVKRPWILQQQKSVN